MPELSRPIRASWFETRGVAALLTMRVQDLILRSHAQHGVSKDEASEFEKCAGAVFSGGRGKRRARVGADAFDHRAQAVGALRREMLAETELVEHPDGIG